MTSRTPRDRTWSRLLWVLLILMPFIVLFLAPASVPLAAGVWFWLALLVCFWLIAAIAGTPEAEPARAEGAGPRMIPEADQPEEIKEVMSVNVATADDAGVRTFRGRLRIPADAAQERLRRALGDHAVPFLQQDDETHAAVVLVPALRKPAACTSRSGRGCIGCCSGSPS